MDLIGRRVEVQFLGDHGEPWFAGTITRYYHSSGMHAISFDDGDKKRLFVDRDLADGIMRWITQDSTTAVKSEADSKTVAEVSVASVEPSKPVRNKRPVDRFTSPAAGDDKPPKRKAGSNGARVSFGRREGKRKAEDVVDIEDDDDDGDIPMLIYEPMYSIPHPPLSCLLRRRLKKKV
jgi:hypothetical protein